MEIQSIAIVTDTDLAQAISELPVYEISDLFLMVVERLDNPNAVKKITDRLVRNCENRFGV